MIAPASEILELLAPSKLEEEKVYKLDKIKYQLNSEKSDESEEEFDSDKYR